MVRLNITTEKLSPSGDLLLSARVNGELIKKRYIDYTAKEAKTGFRQHCKDLSDKAKQNANKQGVRSGRLKMFKSLAAAAFMLAHQFTQ